LQVHKPFVFVVDCIICCWDGGV